MSTHNNFIPINIAIVTISDTRILDNDKSGDVLEDRVCLLYTSPSPRDMWTSRMPSSA